VTEQSKVISKVQIRKFLLVYISSWKATVYVMCMYAVDDRGSKVVRLSTELLVVMSHPLMVWSVIYYFRNGLLIILLLVAWLECAWCYFMSCIMYRKWIVL